MVPPVARSAFPRRTPTPEDLSALRFERDRLKRIVENLSDAAALIAHTAPAHESLLSSAVATTVGRGAALERVEGDELVVHCAVGVLKPERGQRYTRADTASARCLREGRPVSTRDARSGAGVVTLALPLFDQDEAVGVLRVVTDAGVFDPLDRFTLCIHARLLAAALAREQIARHNRELLAQRSAALDYVTSVLGQSPAGVVVQAHDGTVQMVNPAAERLLGLRSADLLGRAFTLGADTVETATAAFDPGANPHRMLARTCPDGHVLEMLMSEAVLRDRHGAPQGLVRTLQDLTAERARNARVHESEQRIRRIIEHSQEAFFSMDESGAIVEWNGTAQRLFGWTHEEAVGSCLEHLLVPPSMRKAFERTVSQYLSTGTSAVIGGRIETPLLRKDGSTLMVDVAINATHQDGHVLFDAFAQDVTQRRAELDLLRREAFCDALTGLANRAQFMHRLKSAFQRSPPKGLAVMFVDLDGFKGINDSYGHGAGDTLLREVAQRMRRSVRQRDTVARLAGDEFVVLLEAADAGREARQAADRMLAAFAEPVDLDGVHATPIQASLGIATLEMRDENVQSLMHRADSAMYEAKRAGGQRVFMTTAKRGLAREARLN